MNTETQKSLKSNMIWNSIGSLTYFGCQWLITILVVRLSSGYETAGTLAFAMSIANIFTPLALYRMRTYQVSDLENINSTADYMGFRIITCAIAIIACGIYSAFTCPASALPSILLYLVFKTLEQLIDVIAGLEQKVMRLDLAGKSFIIRGVLTLISFCVTLSATGSLPLSITSMSVVTIAIGMTYDIPNGARYDSIVPSFRWSRIEPLLNSCFSVTIAAVAAGAVMTIPKQYLGMSLGEEMLGIYSSLASPVAIVQIGGTYVYAPLIGMFAERYMDRDKSGFVKILTRATFAMVGIGLIACIAFFLVGKPALKLLFGEGILAYSGFVPPMIATSMITGYYLFLSDLLLTMREFMGNTLGGILALIASVILALPLINSTAMNGVNLTGSIAYGIGIVISLIFVHKQLLLRCKKN